MTKDEILSALREACRVRKVCVLKFSDETETRQINPHGVCYSLKDKQIIVSVFVKGYSESGNKSNFRNLQFLRCESVEILPKHFVIDPGFNPDDKQYKDWLFHVLQFHQEK